jgi:RNA polymerase-binding transcription factor DksA
MSPERIEESSCRPDGARRFADPINHIPIGEKRHMIDLAKTKAELEAKLRELMARAEDIDDDLRQPGDDDWAENAIESAGDEVLEEIGDIALEEIQQIRLALNRIESGTYGVCMSCAKPIPEERLKARPYSTKCVKCA